MISIPARSRSQFDWGPEIEPLAEQGHRQINVGTAERWISLLGGGALAAFGLSRGTTTGLILGAAGAALAYRGYTGHCHGYQLLGMSSAEHDNEASIPAGQGIKVEESVTIQKPADELFRYWRNLENLPRVMKHLVAVRDLGNNRSHWVAKGLGTNVEWDAEIITERTNEMIGWRSLEGSTVATAGSVHFKPAPGNRGTEVKVSLSYNPPAGRVAHVLAWLAGRDPESEVREDLRSFKRLMETGTVPTTQGQPRGSCCG
jgi:uncharacterized membrane protein